MSREPGAVQHAFDATKPSPRERRLPEPIATHLTSRGYEEIEVEFDVSPVSCDLEKFMTGRDENGSVS